MTKMQAMTQTVLTVLGIYGVLTLLRFYPARMESTTLAGSTLWEGIWLLSYITFAGLMTYWLVLRNSALAARIAADTDETGPGADPAWLTKSLRIGLVLTGLILLPGSIATLVDILKIPILLRSALSEIISDRGVSGLVRIPYHQWCRGTYNLLRALLTLYLVSGAPHLVRSQVRNSFGEGAPAENPERPTNE